MTTIGDRIVEFRLPLLPPAQSLREVRRIVYKFSAPGGSLTLYLNPRGQANNSGIVYLQRVCELVSSDEQTQNLLALQNGQPLSLIQSQVYNGITYPATDIHYRIEIDPPDWENLIFRLDARKPCDRTLSIFFDSSWLDSSNYQVIENEFLGNRLNITIYPLSLVIKNEIYWLPEVGYPLEMYKYYDPAGHFGFYGSNKLYPVSENRVKKYSREANPASYFFTNIATYKVEKAAVDRILLALEKLEGVTVWTPAESSVARTTYKWDAIVKVQGKHYPLSIKSSFSTAREAYKEYVMLQERGEIPFIPVILWTHPQASGDEIAKWLSDFFSLPLKKELTIYSPVSPPKLYKHIDEIGTSEKAHYPLIFALMSTAEQGMWHPEAEALLQAIVERGKNRHYQLIHHCRLIARARTLQAEALESKAELQQQ